MAEQFTSPVLRLIQGTPWEAQTKDQQGAPRLIKTGPNAGQPNPQYFIACAGAKTDPLVQAFKAQIEAGAAREFPTLFPGGPGTPCVNPNFSYKIVDGDGSDQTGKLNASKEGMAGNWVFRFASSYPPKCFARPDYAAHQQLTDPNRIKRGHYVTVAGSMQGNANSQRPGLYLNLDMVSWEGFGPEIVGGRDATDAFGAAPALPAGVSAQPIGGNAPTATPTPPAPIAAPPAMTPAAPTPLATGASPSSAPPYSGYMAPAAAIPAPPTPATAYIPAPAMTAKAGGQSRDAFIAAGWTDAQLITEGMMVA